MHLAWCATVDGYSKAKLHCLDFPFFGCFCYFYKIIYSENGTLLYVEMFKVCLIGVFPGCHQYTFKYTVSATPEGQTEEGNIDMRPFLVWHVL